MKTLAEKVIIVITSLMMIALNAPGQDLCKDVLNAAYSRLEISYSKSATSAAKEWFCSDKFFSDIREYSATGSVTVPIKGIPFVFKASGNSSTSLQKRELFCAENESFFSMDQALTLFSQVVEKRTIEAWEKCMVEKMRATAGTSIYLEEEVIGNDIFVKAKFRIVDDESRHKRPLVMTYFVTNANQVKGDWQAGQEVPLTGILHQFKRIDEHKPVTITLTTTQGISQTLTIKGKEYPLEVGYINASWEEPYQAEGQPQDVYQDFTTGDHHCSSNCRGEPTRTNYTLRLDGSSWGDGYMKDLRLDCIGGPCEWHEVRECRLLNSKVGYGSWDVWTRPTTWRLAAKWVPYVRKWRTATAGKRDLTRGDKLILSIPKNARNVKIYGRTLDGYFEFPIDQIKGDAWLKYGGFSSSYSNYEHMFRVAQRPN